MRNIIKQGRNEFYGKCDRCGCLFKYELSDIIGNAIYCPYCNDIVHHSLGGSDEAEKSAKKTLLESSKVSND